MTRSNCTTKILWLYKRLAWTQYISIRNSQFMEGLRFWPVQKVGILFFPLSIHLAPFVPEVASKFTLPHYCTFMIVCWECWENYFPLFFIQSARAWRNTRVWTSQERAAGESTGRGPCWNFNPQEASQTGGLVRYPCNVSTLLIETIKSPRSSSYKEENYSILDCAGNTM